MIQSFPSFYGCIVFNMTVELCCGCFPGMRYLTKPHRILEYACRMPTKSTWGSQGHVLLKLKVLPSYPARLFYRMMPHQQCPKLLSHQHSILSFLIFADFSLLLNLRFWLDCQDSFPILHLS